MLAGVLGIALIIFIFLPTLACIESIVQPATIEISKLLFLSIENFDSFKIMGKSRSSRDNSSVDLYTKLETVEDQNLINYPNGILNGRNSKIEFLSAVAIKTGGQTSDDTYYSSQWAFYMYDPASDDNFELLNTLYTSYYELWNKLKEKKDIYKQDNVTQTKNKELKNNSTQTVHIKLPHHIYHNLLF